MLFFSLEAFNVLDGKKVIRNLKSDIMNMVHWHEHKVSGNLQPLCSHFQTLVDSVIVHIKCNIMYVCSL